MKGVIILFLKLEKYLSLHFFGMNLDVFRELVHFQFVGAGMKKKILIVTTVAETFQTILADQPAALSRQFDVYIATSGRAEVNNILLRERISGAYHVRMKRGISPFHDILSIIRMLAIIVRLKPDLVHSYTPKAGLVVAIASYIARVPARIHTFTGLIFPTSKGLKKLLLIFCDRVVCHLNTTIVAEGRGVANDLLNYNVSRLEPIIIGNGNIAGVDLSYFSLENIREVDEKLSDLKKKGYKIILCYIGRLHREKGINELMKAIPLLSREISIKLIVAGNLDEENPPSKETLDILYSHPSVIYIGFQQDVRPVIAASDAIILPSYREGFPNVLLQAGALGRPALATNVNGSNEIVFNGENGFLFAPQSVDELVEAVRLFSSLSEASRTSMGESARKNICIKYDRNEYIERLVDFYHLSTVQCGK